MKTLQDILELAHKRLKSNRRSWFSDERNGLNWEGFEIPLQAREIDFHGQIAAFQQWLAEIRTLEKYGTLSFRTVRWQRLGGQLNNVPDRISFASLPAFLSLPSLENENKEWKKATLLLDCIVSLPFANEISLTLVRHWPILVSMCMDDAKRLSSLVHWLYTHRNPDCFIREIPVLGVDTKWLEKHLGLTCECLSQITGESITCERFFSIWKFRTTPTLIRVRHAQNFITGLPADTVISLPVEGFINARARAVFVLENIQTGLALNASEDILILFGLGADVKRIGDINAFRHLPIFYMGDLDAHGLFILNELRKVHPNVRSVLMNLEIFKAYQELAVPDPTRDSKERSCDLLLSSAMRHPELICK